MWLSVIDRSRQALGWADEQTGHQVAVLGRSCGDLGYNRPLRRILKARLRALVLLRSHGELLSRHGVKMASKGVCPGYGVYSRMDWTGEAERASGNKGCGII